MAQVTNQHFQNKIKGAVTKKEKKKLFLRRTTQTTKACSFVCFFLASCLVKS